VLERGHGVDQRGIEPRAAALAGCGAGGGRPALLPEDSIAWARQMLRASGEMASPARLAG
jgi:hypothetical protein